MIPTKNQILNEVRAQIFERKLYNESVAQDNIARANSINGFKELYAQYVDTVIQEGKLLAQNKDTKQILANRQTLTKKLNTLLNKINLQLTDLEPKYTCTKCNDTGILDNGYCSCFKKALSQKYLSLAGVNTNITFKTANMDIFPKDSDAKEAYATMKQYCHKLNTSKIKIVVMCGPTGTGKTYLNTCMANEIAKNGHYVVFSSAFDLNQTFLSYHLAKMEDKHAILDPYLSCDALIIDDLGTENMLNITTQYLYLLINERLNKGLSTIINTNLTPEELFNRYDERIYSRLIDKNLSIILNFNNKDLRKK